METVRVVFAEFAAGAEQYGRSGGHEAGQGFVHSNDPLPLQSRKPVSIEPALSVQSASARGPEPNKASAVLPDFTLAPATRGDALAKARTAPVRRPRHSIQIGDVQARS